MANVLVRVRFRIDSTAQRPGFSKRNKMNPHEVNQAPGQSTAAYRPIHYLGSKLRLTSDIATAVDELNPARGLVCDLFSGSGVVASVLGQSSPVAAVDIQEYARVLASALLHPAGFGRDSLDALCAPITVDPLGKCLLDAWAPLIQVEQRAILAASEGDPEALAQFLEALPLVAFQLDGEGIVPPDLRSAFSSVLQALEQLSLDQSVDSVVSRYFGGLYFGIEQAIQLDVLAHRSREVEAGHQADTVMSAVLSAASAAVGTVGKQFAQPLRPRGKGGAPKPGLWTQVTRDRSIDVVVAFQESLALLSERPPAREGSLAVRADYRDFLQSHVHPISVVYADPPYTRDHYSRYYHVLETIALRDQPSVSRTNLNGGRSVSRGVYRLERHQSPFSICSQAPNAFRELMRLTSHREASLVLSYSPHLADGASRPRVMTTTELEALARQFFRTVERTDLTGVIHSKLTRTDMHLAAPDKAELLLVCRP